MNPLTPEQRARLKQARERKQLTQEQVAAQISEQLSADRLYRIERDGHIEPSLLLTLAHDVYDCSVHEILHGEERGTPS